MSAPRWLLRIGGRAPPGGRRRLPPRPAGRPLSTSSPGFAEPLVIVGGGPSGLFLSCLLSRFDVPHVLLERQAPAARFRHPQAHFLNTRTMELLRFHLPDWALARLLQAMPPVAEWREFRFGHSMGADPPLARVRHPVDRPLSAGGDANGVLLEDGEDPVAFSDGERAPSSRDGDLSPCAVGHLPQHTFGRILYDVARKLQPPHSALRYGVEVTSALPDPDARRMTVACADGSTYRAPLVVAADGAASPLRTAAGIPWRGAPALQHLMNVHVTLEAAEARRLHQHDSSNSAMLYSVFNEHTVAMVVCHSHGDYIVQIPFFPPYQTVERDFAPERLDAILQSIFGGRVRRWTVQSAKPWVMGSLIAQQYFQDRLVLAGDAAHVFPPAGGFGMNTGLQDVHNLAWKLALYHHAPKSCALEGVLRSYQQERQPVARDNAALSVRNYQRLLQVTKACYLNEKHPSLLVSLLDNSPLPLASKQILFRSLFQAALRPLTWLGSHPGSLYAAHIRNNLRKVLREGAGLPLLFPRHELGFQYGATNEPSSHHWKQDTIPIAPEIRIGRLVPHVEATVTSDASLYPNLRFLSTGTISTSNLPAQLSRTACPCFVLLVVGRPDEPAIEYLKRSFADVAVPIETVRLVDDAEMACRDLNLRESTNDAIFSFRRLSPRVVLIRPDSHVSSVCNRFDAKSLESMVSDAMSSFNL